MKQALIIYKALFICSITLPILFLSVDYFLNGKININYFFIIFGIVLLWSLFNIEYIKNKLKSEENDSNRIPKQKVKFDSVNKH